VFGGPPRFSESMGGHSAMLGIHAGQGAESDLGERFVACFVAAADDARLPDDREFRDALRAYMEWAVGEVMAYSPPERADVPTGLPTPLWGWNGLATRTDRPAVDNRAVQIDALDHLVLTVADVGTTVAFYERLGMRREAFGEDRIALRFGTQKVNLHQAGAERAPHARRPTPGSADLCFLVRPPLEDLVAELASAGISIELGPVERTGAAGPIRSVYVRDPDGNLVELSVPAAGR